MAYIKGLQSQGISACTKHFVCNDSEFERNTISSDVPERALREIYLEPFRACVQEAGCWSIMSGYNKLNGVYCSENARLLLDILKEVCLTTIAYDVIIMMSSLGQRRCQVGKMMCAGSIEP